MTIFYRLVAVVAFAVVAVLGAAAPASATDSPNGKFCTQGAAPLVVNGLTYQCTRTGQDDRWRWRAGDQVPTPTPTGGAVPTPASTPTPSGPGGSLPVTGVPTGAIVAGGVLVFAAGAGLVVAGRRRRVRFVAS